MGKFYYRARNRKGELVEGSVRADNEWLARKDLARQNLIPLEIGRFNLRLIFNDANGSVERLTQRVSLEEKITLLGQIEMGISVGIPIMQMFTMLQGEVQNKRLRAVLGQIILDITDGGTLHGAFAKHPDVFDPTIIGLIKTGEVTGKLDETLGRITQLLEQEAENRAKVKSAMYYPKIVAFAMVVVVLVMVYFVIPKIKQFLKNFNSDLPPITQFVVGTSDFFIHYWYAIFGVCFAAYLGFKKAIQTTRGKLWFDSTILKLPAVGKVLLYLELNNFCVILELLLSSGIPLLESLETLKGSQKNQLFKNALGDFQMEISKGGSLAKGMDRHPVFPHTLRSMINIGEETGRISPVLKRLGRYYHVQLNYLLGNLSKALEPILLFMVFICVLILALAVFLPIWKMNAVIKPR
ncbi:MAG: type II secretion system F family protein [Bdellovibrionales bacterium]|nr:type II secretion system F family protein [Bdellovibrionales bacterium]